jgi:hypothetical protein
MCGPRRVAAITWAVLGVLPPLFWLALGWYGQRQWGSRNVPHNLPLALVRMAGASLMEAQARYLYPHRLETDRLVMFYDDAVADPQRDLETMDRHVARLQETTGLTLRAKIWWVRGSLLGQEGVALYGLALGSSTSPAEYRDRHELAHAVIYQGEYPDTDPPTLLVEGWAELVNGKTVPRLAYSPPRYPLTPWIVCIRTRRAHRITMHPTAIMGGGGLIASFLDAGEIDEFDIHIIPVFIGEGIPLVAPRHRDVPLRLRLFKKYVNGIVRLRYKVAR